MNKLYTVHITRQSQEHLRDIAHYISFSLQAPDAAFQLLQCLKNSIISLSQFPHRIPIISDSTESNEMIHKMNMKNYFIYFWIDEAYLEVQILAILNARQEQILWFDRLYLKF